MAEITHRYVGNHAQEIIVGDKVVMAEPGYMLTLSADDLEDAHNKDLVDNGMIVDIKSLSPEQPKETQQPKGGENK